MNLRKITAGFVSAVMIITLSACNGGKIPEEEKEPYHFGGALTLSDVREHFTQGKKSNQNFYLTIDETSGSFESFTEFVRVDLKEVRLVNYGGYITRFIKDKDKYIVIDDSKKAAAVYPYENVHNDIMLSDMDFVISAIDLAMKGELIQTTLNEDNSNADDFELAYKGESEEIYLFRIKEGKLSEMTFMQKSGKIIATYEMDYGSRGGDESLFDYEGYKVTNMKFSEEK